MSRACSRPGTRGSPSAPSSTALASPGDALVHRGGIGGAVAQVAVGAEVERPELERKAARVAVVLEHARGLGDDLGPDAVPGDDGDEFSFGHAGPQA